MNILERIIDILREKGFDDDLSEEASLESLEVDSTEREDIYMSLESEFGIIAEVDVLQGMTLKEIAVYIETFGEK